MSTEIDQARQQKDVAHHVVRQIGQVYKAAWNGLSEGKRADLDDIYKSPQNKEARWAVWFNELKQTPSLGGTGTLETSRKLGLSSKQALTELKDLDYSSIGSNPGPEELAQILEVAIKLHTIIHDNYQPDSEVSGLFGYVDGLLSDDSKAVEILEAVSILAEKVNNLRDPRFHNVPTNLTAGDWATMLLAPFITVKAGITPFFKNQPSQEEITSSAARRKIRIPKANPSLETGKTKKAPPTSSPDGELPPEEDTTSLIGETPTEPAPTRPPEPASSTPLSETAEINALLARKVSSEPDDKTTAKTPKLGWLNNLRARLTGLMEARIAAIDKLNQIPDLTPAFKTLVASGDIGNDAWIKIFKNWRAKNPECSLVFARLAIAAIIAGEWARIPAIFDKDLHEISYNFDDGWPPLPMSSVKIGGVAKWDYTSLVDQLKRSRLVERDFGMDDETWLSLTDSGKRFIAKRLQQFKKLP